jgi:hypothetical protein
LATARALAVLAVDVGVEAVFDVVGDGDGSVVVAVGDDRQDGAEDLFLGDRHVVGDADEDGGRELLDEFLFRGQERHDGALDTR